MAGVLLAGVVAEWMERGFGRRQREDSASRRRRRPMRTAARRERRRGPLQGFVV